MHDTRRLRGVALIGATFGLLALGFAAPTAHAQTVYVAGSGGEFGTLNVTTGQFAQIGTLASTLYGLGFTSDGTLYGVDDQSQLYQIDPTSGVETLQGAINPDSAFTATASGGLLYGLTGDSSAVLFSISPTSRAVTELDTDTGITPDGLFASSGGMLYATSMTATGVSTLYRLTPAGAVTAIGSTGITDSNEAFGAGVFAGNTLYGFNNNGSIYTLNTSTGAATLTHSYNLGTPGDILFAAAVAPAAAPEPSQAAALGLGVLGLAGLALKARRRKAAA